MAKKQRSANIRPRFPYYRSKNNGVVYAAKAHPAGWEDRHPEDFEPVTQFEFNALQQRQAGVRAAQVVGADVGNPGAIGGALGALQASQEADDPVPEDPYPEPEYVGTGAAMPPQPAVQLQDDTPVPVAPIPVAPLPTAVAAPAPAPPPPPAPGALGGALGS